MLYITEINGQSVPQPSVSSVTTQDVNDADAGRSQSGKMYVGKITSKVTLDLQWHGIRPADVQTIRDAIAASDYPTVSYYDMDTNVSTTKTFYAGDRKTDILQFYSGGEAANYSVQLIER